MNPIDNDYEFIYSVSWTSTTNLLSKLNTFSHPTLSVVAYESTDYPFSHPALSVVPYELHRLHLFPKLNNNCGFIYLVSWTLSSILLLV